MTCNDCIHSGVCAIQLEPHYILDRAQKLMRVSNNVEHECLSFKDRSRFVELPCSVGETVYRICPVENGKGCGSCPWEYCDCHDIGFQNDRKNSIREGKANNFAWILKRIPYFRKIYFTTREAAAQALKEREKR